MAEKTTSSEKTPTQLDVPPTREKCGDKEDVKATNTKSHQRAKVRRTMKLPRLKLADLAAQVTEENAHKEISTGSAVGNEVW
jgi:antitoxin component of MazEF toxin-antitoxin module